MVLVAAGDPKALNVMPAGGLSACSAVTVPSGSVAVTLNVSVVLATGRKGPVGLVLTAGGLLTPADCAIFRMKSTAVWDFTGEPAPPTWSSTMTCADHKSPG